MPDQESSTQTGGLKVSVLSSGKILLEGREVSLSKLAEALQAAKLNGSPVEYSRENPEAEPPPEAEEVLKLIIANRLRVALSGMPDLAARAAKPTNVIEWPGIETFFAKVRKQAQSNRGVTLVRPDRQQFILAAPAPGSISRQMAEGVKAVIPSELPRNVAAIAARGALTGGTSGDAAKPPALADISKRVPFFGLLIGLAYVGHAVWIFEGSAEMALGGCEEADVLIVDSDAIGAMPPGWAVDAALVMRNPNILAYDRNRQKIGAMRTAGEVPGRIEFPA